MSLQIDYHRGLLVSKACLFLAGQKRKATFIPMKNKNIVQILKNYKKYVNLRVDSCIL